MRQRLLDALRRVVSTEPPNRTYRPNELRVDTVRAERLRRESRRTEPSLRQTGRSLEELQVQQRRPLESAAAALPVRSRPGAKQLAALKTRTGLRQAWLLKEILGPPLALRNPYNDEQAR